MTLLSDVRAKYPGVYDDLSDQDLADKLYSKFYSDMPRDQFNEKVGMGAPPQDQGGLLWRLGQNFESGSRAGVGSLISSGANAVAAGADAFGFPQFRDKALEFANEADKELVQKNQGSVPSLQDVTLSNFPEYAAHALGSVGMQAIPSLATGVGAAGLAGALGAGTAGQIAAAGAGAFLPNWAAEIGQIFPNAKTPEGKYAPGTAALYGAGAAAIDTLTELIPESRLITPAVKQNILGNIIKGGLLQSVVEGPTEYAQGVIERAAEVALDPKKELWSEEQKRNYLEQGVQGAIGGFGFGAVAGAASGHAAVERPPLTAGGPREGELTPKDEATLGLLADQGVPEERLGAARAAMESIRSILPKVDSTEPTTIEFLNQFVNPETGLANPDENGAYRGLAAGNIIQIALDSTGHSEGLPITDSAVHEASHAIIEYLGSVDPDARARVLDQFKDGLPDWADNALTQLKVPYEGQKGTAADFFNAQDLSRYAEAARPEERLAMAYALYHNARVQGQEIAGLRGETRGFFQKIFDFFRNFGQRLRNQGVHTVEDLYGPGLFENIYTGRVAQDIEAKAPPTTPQETAPSPEVPAPQQTSIKEPTTPGVVAGPGGTAARVTAPPERVQFSPGPGGTFGIAGRVPRGPTFVSDQLRAPPPSPPEIENVGQYVAQRLGWAPGAVRNAIDEVIRERQAQAAVPEAAPEEAAAPEAAAAPEPTAPAEPAGEPVSGGTNPETGAGGVAEGEPRSVPEAVAEAPKESFVRFVKSPDNSFKWGTVAVNGVRYQARLQQGFHNAQADTGVGIEHAQRHAGELAKATGFTGTPQQIVAQVYRAAVNDPNTKTNVDSRGRVHMSWPSPKGENIHLALGRLDLPEGGNALTLITAYPERSVEYGRMQRQLYQEQIRKASLAQWAHNSDRFQRVRDWIAKQFDPFALTPERQALLTQRYLTMGKIGNINDKVRATYDVLKKVKPEEVRPLYNFLTTRDADPNTIARPELRRMAQQVKRDINDIGQQLVDRQIIPAESYEEFRDRYLPRLYLRHVIDGSMSKFGVGRRLSDQGYTKARNRALPEEVRKVWLGQIEDPAFLAATAMGVPMRDMAIIDYLNFIAQNERWVLPNHLIDYNGQQVGLYWLMEQPQILRRMAHNADEARAMQMRAKADEIDQLIAQRLQDSEHDPADIPDGYRRLPNSRRYGVLKNIAVRKEIADDIAGMTGWISDDADFWTKLGSPTGWMSRATQFWKLMKVAVNPPTVARNFMSNAVMVQVFGKVPFVKVPYYFGKAIHEMINDGPSWQVAKKYGVKEGTFFSQEVVRAHEELLDLQARTKGPWQAWHKLRKVAGLFTNKAGDVYQAMEGVAKTAIIAHAMENGASEAEAALLAHEAIFDYSLVPNWVRGARSVPLGIPFVTFYYKVMPQLAKSALQNPVAFWSWTGMLAALPWIIAQSLDVDKDDVDRLRMGLSKAIREKSNLYLIPWKDANGHWQFMDFSYILPWGMYTDAARHATQAVTEPTGEGPKELMRDVGILSGPVLQLAAAMMTNIDPFTRREIMDHRDPPGKQVGDALTYLWRLAAPSFLTDYGTIGVPGLVPGKAFQTKNGERINRYGEPTQTDLQAWLGLAGLNVYPSDTQAQRARNIKMMKQEITDVKSRMKSLIKDQRLTEKDRADIVQVYTQLIRDKAQALRDYVEQSEIRSPKLQ